MNNPQPPRQSLKLMRLVMRKEYLEEIEGDMEEVFADEVDSLGLSKAKRRYTLQVLQLFRVTLLKGMKTKKLGYLSLLKHHVVLSFRGFKRYKTAFIINLTGLSTGLAATLAIFLWVSDEVSVDKFHALDDRLYQVLENSSYPGGVETDISSPALLAKAVKAELPEVEHSVTINNDGGIGSYGFLASEAGKQEVRGIFTTENFFEVFSFPLLDGQPQQVLPTTNSILLSESTALSLFGTTSGLIGKAVQGNRNLYGETYNITGIYKDPPANSTLQFDFVANFQMQFDKQEWLNEWGADGAANYIVLKEGTDIEAFNAKFGKFLENKPDREGNWLFLQPYSDGYLYGNYENGKVAGGRIAYVRTFTITAIFILLIACINFMNLSTAQATRRMKEVGVKKVFGVRRLGLVGQFLVESCLLVTCSFILSLILVFCSLPGLSQLTGKSLELTMLIDFWQPTALVLVVTALFSGIYPALYLSAFKPVQALKGKLSRSVRELWTRKGLVVLQFAISVVFIVGFLVVNRQMSFIYNAEIGYEKEQLVHFKLRKGQDRQPFLAELRNLPGVESVTNLFGGSIVNMNGAGSGFHWGDPTVQEEIQFRRPHVGYNFATALGIEIVEGRDFSPEFANEENKLIINEAAADIIGIDNIVGKTIMDGETEKEVIGVVKNFKIKSLYEEVHPCIMRFIANGWDILVRLRPGAEQQTLSQIEALHQRFDDEFPFESTYVTDEYQALYTAENRLATLSQVFTLIAILISCLGLFGLAAFTAERRIKEIGIRKALGSGTFNIVKLLSADFSKMVVLAIIIALPLSYYMVSSWLDNFAYHINPGWSFFVSAGLAALVVAWLTVGLRTFRAANVNPADCLRNE